MLTFYLGKNKSGKKSKVFDIIKELTSNKNDVLFIVPEQFSFEAEREMLNRLEPKYTAFVSILNFTSLSNEIKRLYGGVSAKIIDNGTRVILMHKVLKCLSSELSFFKSKENSLKTVTTITNTITELKQQAITSKKLYDASQSFMGTALGMKLADLSKIINAYDALLGETYIDPVDELNFAYNKIKESGYFKDKNILFYGFSNFTGQQYKIIKQAICECSSSHIALCTDSNFDNEFSVFANVNSTYAKLVSICKQNNVQVSIEQLNSSNFQSSDLCELEKMLSSSEFDNTNNGVIKAIIADTKYDELEYIASHIHKRVRTEGLRYRDFAVITRTLNEYSGIASGIFKNADVPLFFDDKLSFTELPISTIILSALKASRNFRTRDIYRYLKTGLTDLTENEINEIDNYIYLWSIDSKDWLHDFTKNPFGLQEKSSEEINLSLEKLNSIRKKIILPLLPLSKLKTASGEEFCHAVFSFLENCNVPKNITKYAEDMKTLGEDDIEQYLVSGWKALNEALQNFYVCYKEDTLTFNEFYETLNLYFSSISISGIPQGLDQVNFVSADRIVSLDSKFTYIVGLNYGKFPLEFKNSGIFNNSEKAFLEGLDIKFNDDYISKCIDEDFILYKAITSATNSLHLLTNCSDYNSNQEPSPIFNDIVKKFNISCEYTPYRDNPYLNVETPMQAINASVNCGDITKLEELLNRDDIPNQIKTLINRILSADANALSKLDKNIAKSVYGTELYISPSKLEQFYKCPYSYLFKYGLNISTRDKIDFKFMQRGTIAHYVFEKILLNDFEIIGNAEIGGIKPLIDKYIDEYINATVGGVDLLDGEAKYLLKRIAAMLYDLVPYVVNELRLSCFKPSRFELKIGDDGEIAPIVVKDEDFTAKIGGVVDRVDVAEFSGQAYIRIVDYKTGVKNFKLPDILYGLNLQMLIYLCAICEDGKLGGLPAGIIYQPLNHIKQSGIDKKSNNAAKSKGVIIEDAEIIKAMDPTGTYMPASFKSDGQLTKSSSTLKLDEFQSVFAYVKQKFIEMCRRIVNGDIDAIPCNADSQHNNCTWCDYKNICGRTNDDASITVPSMNKDEVIEKIERSASGGD